MLPLNRPRRKPEKVGAVEGDLELSVCGDRENPNLHAHGARGVREMRGPRLQRDRRGTMARCYKPEQEEEKGKAMKDGIPTCRHPTDPTSMYMRNLYHTFFYGPFQTEAELTAAINQLDRTVVYWDYDPFCLIYGAAPLPTDYVFGFQSVPTEMRARIEAQRLPQKDRPQPEPAAITHLTEKECGDSS